jgi:hypothetical protein
MISFWLYNYLFVKKEKHKQITPIIFIKENKLTLKNSKYYKLTQNIRNSVELTNCQLLFIETLPPENLIELIKIYNDIVILYNSIINKNINIYRDK